MSTATATRTLREVMAERVQPGWPGTALDLAEALAWAVQLMTPWGDDEESDLRPSEVEWITGIRDDAREAAREAAIDAAAAVFSKALRELAEGGHTVPAHLLEQGPDALRADLALVR